MLYLEVIQRWNEFCFAGLFLCFTVLLVGVEWPLRNRVVLLISYVAVSLQISSSQTHCDYLIQTHPEFCGIPVYLVDLVVPCVVKHSWHVSRHIVYLIIFVCELKLKELKALQKQVLRARLCQPGCANTTWQATALACSPLAGRMVGQRIFGQIYNWSKWCIMMS